MDENNFGNQAQMGFHQQQWNNPNPNFYQGQQPGGISHNVFHHAGGGGMVHGAMHQMQPAGPGLQYGGGMQYGGMMQPPHGGAMFQHAGGMPQQQGWPNHPGIGGNQNPNFMNNQNCGWNNQNYQQQQNQANNFGNQNNVPGISNQEQYDFQINKNSMVGDMSPSNMNLKQNQNSQSKDELENFERRSRDRDSHRRRDRRKTGRSDGKERNSRSPPRRDDRGRSPLRHDDRGRSPLRHDDRGRSPLRHDDRDRSRTRRDDKDMERDRSPRRDKRRDSPDRYERRRREDRRREDYDSDRQRDSRNMNVKPTNTIMLKSLHPSVDERDDEVSSLKTKIPGMTTFYSSSYSRVSMSASEPVCIGCGGPLPNSSIDKHAKCPLCRLCGQASPCEVCMHWPADMFLAVQTWVRSYAGSSRNMDVLSKNISSTSVSETQKQQISSDLVKLVKDQVAGEVSRLTEQAIASICQTPTVMPTRVPSPSQVHTLAPPSLPPLAPQAIPYPMPSNNLSSEPQNPENLKDLVSHVMPTVLDYLGIPYNTVTSSKDPNIDLCHPIIPIHSSLIQRLDNITRGPSLKPSPSRLTTAFPLPDDQFRSMIMAPEISKATKRKLRSDQGITDQRVFSDKVRSAYEEVLINIDRTAREGMRPVNISGFLLSFLSSPKAPQEIVPGAFSLLRECIRLISDQYASIVQKCGSARRRNVLRATSSIPNKYLDKFSKSQGYVAKDLFYGQFDNILNLVAKEHASDVRRQEARAQISGPSKSSNQIRANLIKSNYLKPRVATKPVGRLPQSSSRDSQTTSKSGKLETKIAAKFGDHEKKEEAKSTKPETSSKSLSRANKRRRRRMRALNSSANRPIDSATSSKKPRLLPDLMSVPMVPIRSLDLPPLSPRDDWVRRPPLSPRNWDEFGPPLPPLDLPPLDLVPLDADWAPRRPPLSPREDWSRRRPPLSPNDDWIRRRPRPLTPPPLLPPGDSLERRGRYP